ncbi:hypothetical protein TeGR_g14678 [Tetraparma gracilis]|uniref:P-type ATPase A domain-containing protein n=1 Tax=Tetraparma gracilis TaxID=2962635 RepID=A0ABQ6MNF6_9STRA|nr:hypothetical protein TeGR_g14678 [Tetraparma gracilis]
MPPEPPPPAPRSDAASELVGLTTAEAEASHAEHGFNEVVIPERPLWLNLLLRYLGILPIFMTTTAILNAAVISPCSLRAQGLIFGICQCVDLNDWASFILLLVEMNLVVYADFMASRSSGQAMKAMAEASASTVGVRRDGEWAQLPTREIAVGDLVAVNQGMEVPCDGRVASEGEPIKLDYSSLTGEPLPEKKARGDPVLSGAVVLVGEAEMIAEAVGPLSSLGETQLLVAEAKAAKERGGELTSLLSKVLLCITAVGILTVATIAIVFGVRNGSSAAAAVKLAFVILTTILPVTMPLLLTTTLTVGARELMKSNAVVQRLSAIPEMAGMDVLCSDKTGTLTLGKMTVIEEECWTADAAQTADDLMGLTLVASKIEHCDAIDQAVTNYFDSKGVGEAGEDAAKGLGAKQEMSKWKVKRFLPFDPATKMVTAHATKLADGKDYTIVKGAPPVVLNFAVPKKDRAAAFKSMEAMSSRGIKTLAIAWQLTGHDEAWHLAGLVALMANLSIFDADVFNGASSAAGQAGGFDELCEHAGGFAGVSPENKHRVVCALQKRHFVGMTGDGVNDAPALSQANVGVAVAGATDAAKGAADICLTEEGLSPIVAAVRRSRIIFARINTYILYRVASSTTFALLFLLIYIASNFDFPTWVLILMSIINDFTISSCSKDNVKIEASPQVMNLRKVAIISVFIGCIDALQIWGFANTVLYLPVNGDQFWGLTSITINPPGATTEFSGCEVTTYIFLLLSGTLQMSLLKSRTSSLWWMWSFKKDEDGYPTGVPPPSLYVIAAVVLAAMGTSFISVYWSVNTVIGSGFGMSGIGWVNTMCGWGWIVMWFFITDILKAVCYLMWDIMEGEEPLDVAMFALITFKNKKTKKEKRLVDKKERMMSMRSMRETGSIISTTRSMVSKEALVGRLSVMNGLDESAAYADDRDKDETSTELLGQIATLRNDKALLRLVNELYADLSDMHERIAALEAASVR